MPLCASTGPVLGRCCQHRTSTGPVLVTNGMFTRVNRKSWLGLFVYENAHQRKFQFIKNKKLSIREVNKQVKDGLEMPRIQLVAKAFTGANRLAGVDISTRLCMTFACITSVTLPN